MAILRTSRLVTAALLILIAVPAWSRPTEDSAREKLELKLKGESDRDFSGYDTDVSRYDNPMNKDSAREKLELELKGQSDRDFSGYDADFTRYDNPMNKMQQCGTKAFFYCCKFGRPCKCSQGIGARGQCGGGAYEYCCQTGTPCRC